MSVCMSIGPRRTCFFYNLHNFFELKISTICLIKYKQNFYFAIVIVIENVLICQTSGNYKITYIQALNLYLSEKDLF